MKQEIILYGAKFSLCGPAANRPFAYRRIKYLKSMCKKIVYVLQPTEGLFEQNEAVYCTGSLRIEKTELFSLHTS